MWLTLPLQIVSFRYLLKKGHFQYVSGHFQCFGVFRWKSRKCSFAHFRVYLAASVFWHIINELTASGGCACLRHLTASAMFDAPFPMLRLRTRPQQFTSFRGTGTAELRFICPHASLELCLFLVISNLSFLVVFLYNTCCEHSLLSSADLQAFLCYWGHRCAPSSFHTMFVTINVKA